MTDKTYIFVELDKKDQAPGSEYSTDPDGDNELFTNDIDRWIEVIDQVIQNL